MVRDEGASVDKTVAMKYSKELVRINDDGRYCQVFNADETGSFWKKLPNWTSLAKSEKTESGFKVAKDRVTFLLCSNALGA